MGTQLMVDEVPMPSPRMTPRVETPQSETVYAGVIQTNTMRNILTRLDALEGPLKGVDERLRAMEENIAFMVEVHRQNGDRAAFKLIGDNATGLDPDMDPNSTRNYLRRCFCCCPEGSSFL